MLNKISKISLLFLIFLPLTVFSQECLIFNFNTEKDLEGFVPAETGDRGKVAIWKIVSDKTAPSGGKALFVIPDPKTNRGSTFNTFIYTKQKYKNVDVSVWIKAVKGREDQGGGILWRAKDKDNYYVVRWNPLEDNFNLYYVKNAHRRLLKSVDFYADPKKWHKIRVVNKGNEIRCYFDGKLKIKYRTKIFKDEGFIGLWTKADASSEFDDLTVREMEK